MLNEFSRTELLLGGAALERLRNARVAIFGIGGVGGYVAEALARSGISHLDLIDKDEVSLTNINRQIIALHSTIGRAKVDVMKERILDINPAADVRTYQCFYLPETQDQFDFSQYDYIVDAVDTVTAKLALITQAKAAGDRVVEVLMEEADIKNCEDPVYELKDGSIRYGYTGTYSSDYGDTTMSAKLGDGTTVSSHDAYDSKAKSIDFTADQVRKGITLHVTTKVKNDYVSQGYYVKGFVVTGYEESFSVLWQDETQDQSWIDMGYNEFDLTLPEYPAKNVEITPVYWIKETTSGANVRFYVDGFAGEVLDVDAITGGFNLQAAWSTGFLAAVSITSGH